MAIAAQLITSLDEIELPGLEAQLSSALGQRLLNACAIGIFREGQSFLRLANCKPDSQFEIGSITKVFTAELLSICAQNKVVHLEDPFAKFLPAHIVRVPNRDSITLLDLATHHSGLPRLPFNLRPVSATNPYSEYGRNELEEFLASVPLQRPTQPAFLYSNLGYALLGYALAQATGCSYDELLYREIVNPLAFGNTTLALNGAACNTLLDGYTHAGYRAPHWTFAAFAPVGALRSSAADLLQWLAWLLDDPDRTSLQPQAANGAGSVGLGWMIRPDRQSCWHNGGTGGFSSYLALHRTQGYGVILLANRHAASLVMNLGANLERALQGKPLIPLKGDYGRGRARLIEPINKLLSPLSYFKSKGR